MRDGLCLPRLAQLMLPQNSLFALFVDDDDGLAAVDAEIALLAQLKQGSRNGREQRAARRRGKENEGWKLITTQLNH